MQRAAEVAHAYLRALSNEERIEDMRVSIEDGVSGALHVTAQAALRVGGTGSDASSRLTRRLCEIVDREEPWRLRHPDPVFESVKHESILHGRIGFWFVMSEVGSATGDEELVREGRRRFISALAQPPALLEFAFGSAGHAWALACLLEAKDDDATALRELAESLVNRIWCDAAASFDASQDVLGMAHGHAGVYYAVLRCCRAARIPYPQSLREAVLALATQGKIIMNGMVWPVRTRDGAAENWPGEDASWCNGSAGLAHLWALCHDAFGDELFRRLTFASAVRALDRDEPLSSSWCCGRAGHASALALAARLDARGPWDELARRVSASLPVAPALGPHNHALLKENLGMLLAPGSWL